MGKPKILVDVFYLYVAQTGIKTYLLTVCEQIASQNDGLCEYIISPDPKKINSSSFFRGKTSKWKNLLFQFLYLIRKQLVLPILSYYYQADVIFSGDILSPLWGRGKKVSVIHDTFFWDSPDHYQALWLKYYLFLLEKGLRENGEIVTITHFSKSRLMMLPEFEGVPIHVVHSASSLQGQSPINVSESLHPYFLHVGVLEKRKNLGMLIRAFAEIIRYPENQNFQLFLIGQKGPRETLDDSANLELLVKNLHLEEKVRFLGHVSKEVLAEYYHGALGYVFPSLNEGFGLPVLEAFAFDVPVIISKQGALMEVAADAALVLEENTTESLAKAMLRLIADPDLRTKLIAKGRMRLKTFTKAKFFLSLDEKFKEIVNE
jgi:glycosyltransferase involved in cell wall biosynthesis